MVTRRQEDPPRLPSSPLAPEPTHNLASILHQELHRLGVGRMLFERESHTPACAGKRILPPLGSGSDSMWQDRTRMLGTPDNVMRLKRDWTIARAWLRQELSP
jgi:hypothetical protein